MTTIKRAHNFNAGPAALPLPVLQKAQEELVDFEGSGMSVMEMSHRSKEYDAIHNKAISLLKELLAIPDGYDILFLQGGASLQFSMIPLNFLTPGKKAGYVLTGVWSNKAHKEAQMIGDTFIAASAKEGNFRHIPKLAELQYDQNATYLHITSNNTIYGTQWKEFPDTGNVPLFADMSSDILSRPFDASKFAFIYAGAQKNLGPAGVTVVIMRQDLLKEANPNIPTMLRYGTHAKDNSLFNTPPTFAIYLLGLVLGWVKESGGVAEMYKRSQAKAGLIYDTIDQSQGFYVGHAQPDARSLMNITFRLASEELEKKFLEQAKKEGFVGLNGHRLVGGCRASLYNAVPYEASAALRDFMVNFQKTNG